MRTFVLRARAAPTDSQALLAGVGGQAHPEILAHALMNAFFVAQGHRPGVVVYLVLERTHDYARTICMQIDAMQSIGGFDERALLGRVAQALDASHGMEKDTEREVAPGISVRTTGFDKLVRALAQDHQLYLMDRKGAPLAGESVGANPCFLLTDHIPMPKKIVPGLERLGARKITLGPTMLFASQCVTLIHHALDQR